jgi:transcription elongation factor GreA
MTNTFLTQEGYQKLQDELDYLRTDKRKEIADRLREAMEGGELIENAEYEAAKNEQAFVEGRIKELEILLATAKVIEDTPTHDTAGVGSTVVIKEEGSKKEETYTVVGAAEADPHKGRISNESPLGKALIGHKSGEKITVEAPAGPYKVHLVSVK